MSVSLENFHICMIFGVPKSFGGGGALSRPINRTIIFAHSPFTLPSLFPSFFPSLFPSPPYPPPPSRTNLNVHTDRE